MNDGSRPRKAGPDTITITTNPDQAACGHST